MSTIVKARRVINGTGSSPRDMAAVIVEEGRVAEVVEQSTLGEITAHAPA